MPSRWDVQVAPQCKVQAQGTPQSAPHHTVVPITDESTKGFYSFRGTTYWAVVDRSCPHSMLNSPQQRQRTSTISVVLNQTLSQLTITFRYVLQIFVHTSVGCSSYGSNIKHKLHLKYTMKRETHYSTHCVTGSALR